MRSYALNRAAARTVALPGGGSLTYRAVTAQSHDACKIVARKKKSDLLANAGELQELGLMPEDADNDELAAALFMGFFIGELGARHITSWTGIADESGENDAAVTPDSVRKLLKHPIIAAAFYHDVMQGLQPEIDKKKGLATAAPGTSEAAPDTAPDAPPTKAPAPSESPA